MLEKLCPFSVMRNRLLLVLALCIISCQKNDEAPEPLVMRKANDSLKLTEIEKIHLQADSSRVIGVITSIQVAKNGDFYLNDESSATVQVYSSEGKFLRRIGKFGQGPGEFEHNKIIRLAQDGFGVRDLRSHKISFFDFEGNYLKDLRFATNPKIIVLGEHFDYSPRGTRIYVSCIETNLKPKEECKSLAIAAYNENLKLVSLGGKIDPIVESYCEKFLKDSIVRTDKYENIYLVHERLPRITKYTPEFQKLGTLNFYTNAWKHPYDDLDADVVDMELRNVIHSRVLEMEIGKKTGRIFVYHGWKDVEQSTKEKQKVIHTYLSVLSADDKLLIAAQRVPLSPMAINDEEDIFLIKEYTSSGCIIGKYKLIASDFLAPD
ncbi:MAG: 6-bladed beta-propeller [Candidatus Nitrosotenuis sp.]